MIDGNTDKVILAKVVRSKGFELGKSVVLERKFVAIMDDGTIRVIEHRRPEHFMSSAPRVVTFVARRVDNESNYFQTVQRIREWEGAFITAELPEFHRP